MSLWCRDGEETADLVGALGDGVVSRFVVLEDVGVEVVLMVVVGAAEVVDEVVMVVEVVVVGGESGCRRRRTNLLRKRRRSCCICFCRRFGVEGVEVEVVAGLRLLDTGLCVSSRSLGGTWMSVAGSSGSLSSVMVSF